MSTQRFFSSPAPDSAPLWQRLVETPWGTLHCIGTEFGLSACAFSADDATTRAKRRSDATPNATIGFPVADVVEAQIHAYVAGDLAALERIPVDVVGTPFQLEVWQALRALPVGSTTTYGDLARQGNRVGAERAVGAANGANPVAVVVPCHRVIGKDGKLVGYAFGIERKRQLLVHEGALLF